MSKWKFTNVYNDIIGYDEVSKLWWKWKEKQNKYEDRKVFKWTSFEDLSNFPFGH